MPTYALATIFHHNYHCQMLHEIPKALPLSAIIPMLLALIAGIIGLLSIYRPSSNTYHLAAGYEVLLKALPILIKMPMVALAHPLDMVFITITLRFMRLMFPNWI